MARACPSPELLAAWSDRRLSADERAGVDAHLAQCDDCRRVLVHVDEAAAANLQGSFLQRARSAVLAPFRPRPPFHDALDGIIEILISARERSLEFADEVEATHRGQHAGPIMVSLTMPGPVLDEMVLDLESARRHRNHLDRYRTYWFRTSVAILGLSIFNAVMILLRTFGWLP